MPPPVVGVVGASTRAAVHSLARAGFQSRAVDLFADRDLARVAPCDRCPFDDYPAGLATRARHFPPGPVLYTGGLENHPAVVADLAESRELWGNPPGVLEAVRDPHRLFPALAGAGLPVPALVPSDSPCPATGRWLRKPLRSSAGHGIRSAKPGEPAAEGHVFQEFIDGAPMSAVYLDASLIGVTEQLVGEPWLHAKPFAYCGSLSQQTIDPAVFRQMLDAGLALGAAFGLRGVWNIDFVVRDGVPFAVEVNPRYSASVEVVEHATRQAVWSGHSVTETVAGVCDPGGTHRGPRRPHRDRLQEDTPHGVTGPHAVGKAIYFAPHGLTFPHGGPWDADLEGAFDPWHLPAFADIPEAGSRVDSGQPVLTVLVAGSSPAECRERLQSRAAELDALLAGGRP